MKIWLINHYAVPPKYYPLSRPYLFAKNLLNIGHDVTIIAASTVHNSNSKNLIEGRDRVKRIVEDNVPYVLINCTPYKGNGIRRVNNICEFARRLPKVLDSLEKPDVVVATSFDPLSCYEGIKYAKTHGIKAIAEIADLWPETLVDYSGLRPNNPIVKYLRRIEKKIYLSADKIVFTMEGAYDYLIEQRWDKEVPKSKVFFINNGIDLEGFDYNRKHYQVCDEDLLNPNTFKVIYAGSIRKVNNVGKLLDVAKLVKNSRIRFLIWGDGDELEMLKNRLRQEKIENVVFKGRIDKKYIPFITSQADLNIVHNNPSHLFRFGVSFNKIFDYLAAGRPILCDFKANYNPVVNEDAGISVESGNVADIASQIDSMVNMDLDAISFNARKGASKYDFKELTRQLLDVITSYN